MVRSIFTRDSLASSYEPAMVDAMVAAELKYGDQVPTGTYLDMTANLPLVDPPQGVLCPVLLIRGDHDGIATVADLFDFYRQLPQRRSAVRHRAGRPRTIRPSARTASCTGTRSTRSSLCRRRWRELWEKQHGSGEKRSGRAWLAAALHRGGGRCPWARSMPRRARIRNAGAQSLPGWWRIGRSFRAGARLGQTISVDIDPDGKSVWVFERCGDNKCAGASVAPDSQARCRRQICSRPSARNMFVFPARACMSTATAMCGSPTAGGENGKGPAGHQIQRRRQGADDAGQGRGCGRWSGHVQCALRCAGRAQWGTSSSPTAMAATPMPGSSSFSKDGKFIKAWGPQGRRRQPSSTCRTGWRSIPPARLFVADRAKQSHPDFRSGRTAAGRVAAVSAGRAASSSTATTCSIRPIRKSNPGRNPGFNRGIRIGQA